MKNKSRIFTQMTRVIEEASYLLVANSNDFWEGDREKLCQANPGLHLWIVSQSGTDFFRLGGYPSQGVLEKVVQNRLETYGRNYVQYYKVDIVALNNTLPKKWERPWGSIELVDHNAAIALIRESFSQQISA